MSRIGRAPIAVPAGVEVKIEDNNVVTVKGPKGTLTQQLHPNMTIKQEGTELHVTRPNDLKENRSLHGLTRSLLHNMVVGVTDGFKKSLDVNGVGYRVAMEGGKLVMNLGFSHQVIMEVPAGLTVEVPNPNQIVVSGNVIRRTPARGICASACRHAARWAASMPLASTSRGRCAYRTPLRISRVLTPCIFCDTLGS